MHFHLENSWFDCSIVEHLSNLLSSNVAESDVADKTLSYKSLHSLPCLLVCHTRIKYHLGCATVQVLIEVDPLRWIKLLNGHEWLSDWEVNQVQVKIIHTEIGHSFLTSKFDMLGAMECVP